MGIENVLKFSDTDTTPTIQVGAVVVSNVPFTDKLPYPHIPGISGDKYKMPSDAGYAIVVSMAPFTLASANGDMRWQTTIVQGDFKAVGMAKQEFIDIAMTRAAS